MGGFASCLKKNFLYTYQVCMFPEKHQGTLREHMSCGVQLSAQPSMYIYIIYIYIFSNRYTHIPRTSKYPEKLLKLWKLCGKLPFLWWLGGSKIYIYMRFCLEKIFPWRHSKFWNAGKMQFSSFAVKKTYKHLFQSVTVTGIPASGPSRR